MIKVFVDGKEGTTGLKIAQRLKMRPDIELLEIDESKRKDSAERKKFFAAADIAFLCLPDAAAVEAAKLSEGSNVRLIDTSTAHRTAAGWVYGFPELSEAQKDSIRTSDRVAVPGCHASGFIAIVSPLTEAGIVEKDALLTAFSLTGYSGGGKKMIAQYENEKSPVMDTPGVYALRQTHKHLKEMAAFANLSSPPVFSPIVDDFYSGMLVTVPFFGSAVKGGIEAVKSCLNAKYEGGGIIKYKECDQPTLFAGSLTGKDSMEITVSGNKERFTVSALYDNLGKGASGAAMQCMNIMIGTDEKLGLCL